MTAQDQYLQSQLGQILQPGEQVIHAAYMRRQPGLWMQILLVGGLLLFLMTKAYFAVLTDRRLILIRTKMSFWSGGPKTMNLGVESIDIRAIQKVTVSGFMNNRSMTFHMADGKKETLRISPWFKQISGTKAFFEAVPKMFGGGQPAMGGQPMQMQQMQQPMGGQPMQMQAAQGMAPAPQLAAYGAPQQQQQQGYGAPQQAYGAPAGYGAPPQQQQPQQQGYGAPAAYGPPPAQPQGFAPGTRVQVAGQDGRWYPASVVAPQGDGYLCAMPDGQQHWFPAQAVSPG